MKFVHAADLHLDSPLRGLARYEGAPVEQIRGATRRAMRNLVELCLQEQASLLVIAGDLYDDDWRDYSTGLFLSAQMASLHQAGIQVVWIRGNHDAASKLTRYLRLPPNMTELLARKPDTVRLETLGVAVHGQGFSTPDVSTDLSAAYPAPLRGWFNIGLLHTALDGREGHAPYAPCKLDALVHKGYDYWALGHVHRREELHRDPWVVFPGNLQGRHARETGPKGASLITVENGRVLSVEHRTLDDVRWADCSVDVSGAKNEDDVLEAVAQDLEREVRAAAGRLLAVRLRLIGTSAAHAALGRNLDFPEQLRSRSFEFGGAGVWLEKVHIATSAPVDLDALRRRDDPVGQLAKAIDALRADSAEMESLLGEFSELKRKLPAELFQGMDGLGLDGPEQVAELLSEVEGLLLPRLARLGETIA